MPRPIKTRFAPSPTGLLHLGNVRTALFNYLLARRENGTFLLRIEDTDAMRGHEKYTEALQADLRWLGLAWGEGPGAAGGHGPYAQSERGALYQQYFEALETRGLAYPCFCTEHELAIARKTALAAGRAPRYSGKCRNLSTEERRERFAAGTPATLRFYVEDGRRVEFEDGVRGPQAFGTSEIGDFIIRRSDGTPAFFFCNAIDDALMEVTLVVRGEDHLTNTPRQILLLEALGMPIPSYAHIALVVGADGAPLSKRTGSRSVQEMREAGFLAGAVNNYLARLGHTYESNAFLALDGLAAEFSRERLHRAPARFDEQHLLHWQREAIRHASVEELWDWLTPATRALVPAVSRTAFLEVVRGNVLFPPDVEKWSLVLFRDELEIGHDAHQAIEKAGREFFDIARRAIEKHGDDFKALSTMVQHHAGVSGKVLYQPLRAALTGALDGPEMAKLLPLMGAERARARLVRWTNQNGS